jgi:hypothetical protein
MAQVVLIQFSLQLLLLVVDLVVVGFQLMAGLVALEVAVLRMEVVLQQVVLVLLDKVTMVVVEMFQRAVVAVALQVLVQMVAQAMVEMAALELRHL